jgi:hypothetical protein
VILFYLVSHSGLLLIVLGLLYVVIPLVTRTSVARFARAMLPAQIVVVSTRSSLAALPAMLDGAQRELGIPAPVASFALPLGVSLLRANTGLSWVVCALFSARLYGVPLGFGQLIGLARCRSPSASACRGSRAAASDRAPYYAALGCRQGIGIPHRTRRDSRHLQDADQRDLAGVDGAHPQQVSRGFHGAGAPGRCRTGHRGGPERRARDRLSRMRAVQIPAIRPTFELGSDPI